MRNVNKHHKQKADIESEEKHGILDKKEKLKKKIEKLQAKKRQKERKKQKKRKRRKRKKKAFWNQEEEHMEQKVKLTNEIFAWADEFVHSKEYEKLCTLIRETTASLLFAAGLWIHTGDWGHEMEGGYGCWSRLYLTEDPAFTYSPGYKWMGQIQESLHFDTPETMAKQLTLTYIEQLHTFIFNGEIYDRFSKELERSI